MTYTVLPKFVKDYIHEFLKKDDQKKKLGRSGTGMYLKCTHLYGHVISDLLFKGSVSCQREIKILPTFIL